MKILLTLEAIFAGLFLIIVLIYLASSYEGENINRSFNILLLVSMLVTGILGAILL